MTTSPSIVIGLDNNVPVIEGECPTCKRGTRSLILVNYHPNVKYELSEIYMKCMCCLSKYKTQVRYVCDE